MNRRHFFATAGAVSLSLTACSAPLKRPERGPIRALFEGDVDAGGPAAAAHRGLTRLSTELGIAVRNQVKIGTDRNAMLTALRDAARSDASMIVTIGDAFGGAVQRVAWEYPQQRFTLAPGTEEDLRPNVARYDLAQEQSSYLAGALAGLTTKSKVVGHIGSDRSARTLQARAAFAAGLRATNADARFLTTLAAQASISSGSESIARAQRARGADLLYIAFDANNAGALAAVRGQQSVATGAPPALIGEGDDWVERAPGDYLAAAVADTDRLMQSIGRDVIDSVWRGDLTRRFGVRSPLHVRLALSDRAAVETQARISDLRQELLGNRIDIPTRYDGAEFALG